MSNNLIQMVKEILRKDSVENYASPEAVAESVTSEVEQSRELTVNDAAIIGELCEEWFAYEQ